ncbi:MAG TPA: 23S rRNA (uracil(1939)-C(5))-methyltransferase RlmD [Spirochaetota bacterium]|jgi:23S rRNA (uracil-5-)-methyltransferase RumA|nr:23S rRNA (uracil(1939)-C(5))-methyltransferase RlmD [Spirochaetota bacterium]HPD78489.1 23S rRNA (uracil(1939)-C(5))-methyltransferase RlmD [Spirochaetota bacterium]HRS63583.1 23S rRNA (uracil(1939)-C(5))-methyltransferase RlmD [Spirochaetota bacterium]HRU64412.1 23S rRNA (uracil(1939)-C(5))-methyltransferase RlmD [Spirochaetota bacterium]
MKKKKRKFFNELIEKYKGEGAVPFCRYFGDCGGCLFQNVPYENQLKLKVEYLNIILEGLIEVNSIVPSVPFMYRNRMDMVTAFGKKGLRRSGTYRHVVDIESCPLMQGKSSEVYGKLRLALSKIEDYNYLTHEGYLRYIILRQARFTGEVMANFVVASPEDRFGFALMDILDELDSCSILLNSGLGDLSIAPLFKTIKKGFITESFDEIEYMITPNSFFQSNSEIALKMYREILSYVKGRTLDLYSGVGSISLFVAKAADSVTGVEISQESVAIAEENRENNSIDNVEFICADAMEFIKEHKGEYDTVIVDPPRSGMHPKVIGRIEELRPERIIYMSCNPSTFRDDLHALENYKITHFAAYDMFPQTPHIETLALLERKI